MKIFIEYDSKYSLSTIVTDYKDNKKRNLKSNKDFEKEYINKNSDTNICNKKTYFENIKEIGKYYQNYKYTDITKNTIIGILCRLIGEIRRIDKLNNNHPIIMLKDNISFINKNYDFSNELITLHTKSKDIAGNGAGIISKEKENIFLCYKNPCSETLLSVFKEDTTQKVYEYLNKLENDDESLRDEHYEGSINIKTIVNELNMKKDVHKNIIKNFHCIVKNIEYEEMEGKLYYGNIKDMEEFKVNINKAKNNNITKDNVSDIAKKNNIEKIENIFGFLIAKKVQYLLRNKVFINELTPLLIKGNKSIKGIAPNSGSMTAKDYFSFFVGEKKKSWTLPYSVELNSRLFKKEDLKDFNANAKVGVTKECGELIINIDISEEKAIELYKRIENAGVNTFHLGKKGLAYVTKIEMERS